VIAWSAHAAQKGDRTGICLSNPSCSSAPWVPSSVHGPNFNSRTWHCAIKSTFFAARRRPRHSSSASAFLTWVSSPYTSLSGSMSIGTSGRAPEPFYAGPTGICTTQMPSAEIRHLAIYIRILVGSRVKDFPLVRASVFECDHKVPRQIGGVPASKNFFMSRSRLYPCTPGTSVSTSFSIERSDLCEP
jgi:hypothetical protein